MTHLEHYMSTPVAAMSDDELCAAISLGESLQRIMAGMPSGSTLWDAALCKFHRRDPLAVEFMQNHSVAA